MSCTTRRKNNKTYTRQVQVACKLFAILVRGCFGQKRGHHLESNWTHWIHFPYHLVIPLYLALILVQINVSGRLKSPWNEDFPSHTSNEGLWDIFQFQWSFSSQNPSGKKIIDNINIAGLCITVLYFCIFNSFPIPDDGSWQNDVNSPNKLNQSWGQRVQKHSSSANLKATYDVTCCWKGCPIS